MLDFFRNSYVLVAINDVVIVYLYSLLQRTFYTPKEWTENRRPLRWLVYLLTWGLFVGANMLAIVPLNMVASVAAYVIPLLLCYKVNNARGIVYFIFFIFSTFMVESFQGIFIGSFSETIGLISNYNAISLESMVVLTLVEIIIARVICMFGNKDKDKRIDSVALTFVFVPLVSVVLIIIDTVEFMKDPVNANVDKYSTLLILLLIFNIVFFITLEKYTKLVKKEFKLKMDQMKLQSDADVMEYAVDTMKERLASTEELMRQDRAMRHDRRHFEALLLSLLQEGEIDEAKRCLEERLATEPHAAKRYCDNTTVNAALTHYVAMASRKSIKVTVHTNIPTDLEVDELQLAIAVSNLIENAIHACEKLPVEERFIEITAKYKKQLLFEVVNSCDGKAQLDEEGHPVTSDINHGTGTRSVLAFVHQTDSEIRYIAEDKVFKVRMIIN